MKLRFTELDSGIRAADIGAMGGLCVVYGFGIFLTGEAGE
jgi:hypothetical protein